MKKNKMLSTKKAPLETPQEFQHLYHAALPYLKRAHSPYSHVRVASTVLMTDGQIFGGCNVENASYGGTICAERVAITKAISEGSKSIQAILVVTNQKSIWPPCGLCRQVIAEFARPETTVYCADQKGHFEKHKFSELFPGAFSPSHLLK